MRTEVRLSGFGGQGIITVEGYRPFTKPGRPFGPALGLRQARDTGGAQDED